jgi:hypothetical protein
MSLQNINLHGLPTATERLQRDAICIRNVIWRNDIRMIKYFS